MRIITINVNGIRAAEKKGFFTWLAKQNADVVCLQEIKAQEQQLDAKFYPKDMQIYYHSAEKKGYSGTAIYCKQKPDNIYFSDWQDINAEGRLIQVDFGDLSVASLYLPSGSSKQEMPAQGTCNANDVAIVHLVRIGTVTTAAGGPLPTPLPTSHCGRTPPHR